MMMGIRKSKPVQVAITSLLMAIAILFTLLAIFATSPVQAGWQVAPNGDATDRPLKFIARDPNIPTRVPVGYPCDSDVIGMAGGTNAWVYMRDGYDLAAVCEWVDPQAPAPTPEPPPVDPTPVPPPVTTNTFSHAYDAAAAIPNVSSIVSYIRGGDGTTWNAWQRRVVGLTGCTKYPVASAAVYEYRETYANSDGVEGPSTATVSIQPSSKPEQC